VRYILATTVGVALLASGYGVVSAQSQTAAQEKKGDAARLVSSSVAQADQKFVKEAAMGGMAEVDLGRLAVDKGSSADVKAFGTKMVSDHGAANEELKSLASSKSIMLTSTLDSKHQATHDRLAKLSGSAFDRAYVSDMLKDHQTDVSEFRREASGAKDPEIKAWAAKTLPTLEEHLKRIGDLDKKVTATRATK
jgi:putative membrane protein